MERTSRDMVMGKSKGALAANTSLVVVISGRYARPRSRSVLEDVVVAGDAPIDARRRGLPREWTAEDGRRNARSRADHRVLVQLNRRDSPIASAWTALMSGGAKVTWSPHTCAYNRKRSLFHYKSVY